MKTSKKNLILENALVLFLKNGIHVVSMDDIASACGISKKTIYIHFENKSDLLKQLLRIQIVKFNSGLRNYPRVSSNAIVELQILFSCIKETLSFISPTFFNDLKKRYSEGFFELIKFRDNSIFPFLEKNIKRGQSEKIYKKELNIEDVLASYNIVYHLLITDSFFMDIEKGERAINFLNRLFIYSLVSVKGFKILNNKPIQISYRKKNS